MKMYTHMRNELKNIIIVLTKCSRDLCHRRTIGRTDNAVCEKPYHAMTMCVTYGIMHNRRRFRHTSKRKHDVITRACSLGMEQLSRNRKREIEEMNFPGLTHEVKVMAIRNRIKIL